VNETPLWQRTAGELARMVREGEVGPLAVAAAALGRIDALDSELRAWVHVDRAAVLAEAQALDSEARAGRFRGPLHGVPIGIKDIFDVAGVPTRAGAAVLSSAPPAEQDSDAAGLLRAAGALIVGKTVTTAFASADAAATRNPWNHAHTPGGSSSGSAASVAAGMVPAALGTQTAGSVLRPAAFCGIVGFKPSFGRISRRGVIPFAWSLDTIGTLTRTTADAALLLSVLAQPERGPAHASQPGTGVPPRIGYAPRLLADRQHPRTGAALAAAAAGLQEAGAKVEEATLPADFATAVDAQYLIMTAEGAAFHTRSFGDRLQEYEPKIRALVQAGMALPAVAYLDAQRVRADLLERVLPLFARCDALLVPAAAGPAPKGLDFTGDTSFNGPWTLLGLPAIALPAGADTDGLPLGLQLVGRPRQDEALLRVAAWCETVLAPPAWPPGLYA